MVHRVSSVPNSSLGEEEQLDTFNCPTIHAEQSIHASRGGTKEFFAFVLCDIFITKPVFLTTERYQPYSQVIFVL